MTTTQPVFTSFGRKDDRFDIDDDGDGSPGVGQVGRAIQLWACCQPNPVSIGEAALTFNLPLWMVATAVEAHPWMELSGPATDPASTIEHEGE